jgi:NAD(P)-dependent dehydrogenase (short-subunit alcohol dehydrogenase family)
MVLSSFGVGGKPRYQVVGRQPWPSSSPSTVQVITISGSVGTSAAVTACR